MELKFSNNGILTTSTEALNAWSYPEILNIIEYLDRIEFIYKETSIQALGVYPARMPEERVFKIVYSCVDGKLNKSDRIYGKIKPATKEQYIFE